MVCSSRSSDTGATVSVINDDDEAKNGSLQQLQLQQQQPKKNCRIFQKGDCSLLLGIMGIASFCLAYYFTRDERFVIKKYKV